MAQPDRAGSPAALPVRRQRTAWLTDSALRSLRHRDFRLFWLALGLAMVGFQVQRVALGFLAYDMTGSALFLTVVFFGDSLPMVILSPIAGVIVDRLDRRLMLILTRGLIGVLAALLAALVFGGLARPWHLLAFTLITGVLYSFDIPARQAAVRDLVPDDDFFNAVAITATFQQSTRIVGPAIGGLLLVVTGPGGALALMAFANAGTVALIALVRLVHRPSARAQSVLANFRDGLRFVAGQERVWALMLISAIGSLFGMTYQSLTPVFAQDILGQGRAAIGAMLSAAGVGALVGSLAITVWGHILGRAWVSAAAAIAFGLLVALFGRSTSYPLTLTILVAVGALGALYQILNNSVVQTLTPREMQGRVMGVYQMTWNSTVLGSFLIGGVADRAGAPTAAVVAGLVTAVAVAVVLVARPGLRAQR